MLGSSAAAAITDTARMGGREQSQRGPRQARWSWWSSGRVGETDGASLRAWRLGSGFGLEGSPCTGGMGKKDRSDLLHWGLRQQLSPRPNSISLFLKESGACL